MFQKVFLPKKFQVGFQKSKNGSQADRRSKQKGFHLSKPQHACMWLLKAALDHFSTPITDVESVGIQGGPEVYLLTQ